MENIDLVEGAKLAVLPIRPMVPRERKELDIQVFEPCRRGLFKGAFQGGVHKLCLPLKQMNLYAYVSIIMS